MRQLLVTMLLLSVLGGSASAQGKVMVITSGSRETITPEQIRSTVPGDEALRCVAYDPSVASTYANTAGDGMYKIEMPASGGSINNDAEGYGWFTGVATGVLPWKGPVIQFSSANITNSMVNGNDKLELDTKEVDSSATAAGQFAEAFDNDGTGGDFNLSSLSVTGSTTFTGNVALADGLTVTRSTNNLSAITATGNGTGNGALLTGGSGTISAGLACTSAASSIGRGIYALGTLAGHGFQASGGATGHGMAVVGGGTSGVGLSAQASNGHAISAVGNGTNAHGLFVQGGTGGTSDGINVMGGTGGVPIRGDITGTITAATNLTTLPTIPINWITNTGIAADAIGASELATDAIGSNELANDAIDSNKIAPSSIGSSELATDAITAAKIAAGAIVKGTEATGWNDLSAAQVNAEADTAPADYNGWTQADADALFDGAPTFAEAMDAHEYTSPRALKLDNLDTPVSDLRPSVLVRTTIDGTPASQTSFALADGPPDDDALNGAIIIVTDSIDDTQKAVGLVKDYDESTRTVTLVADPGIFTFADEDKVDVIAGGAAIPLWLSGP